tara:strand:- start:453 stop:1322 length:870 start_codon:yes stop_codon:yes gene_type:complete
MLKDKLRYRLKYRLSSFRKIDNNNLKILSICGAAGGGTTLVSSLLDQYFDFDAVCHESAIGFPRNSVLHIPYIRYYKSLPDYKENVFNSHLDIGFEEFRKLYYGLYKFRSSTYKVRSVIDKAPNFNLTRAEHFHKSFNNVEYLVIFRDPVENIEGFMRKWPLFSQSGHIEMAKFWNDIFSSFLNFYEVYNPKVFFVNLDQIKDDEKEFIDKVGMFFSLEKREIIKKYQNKSNKSGMALRNVKNGEIQISKKREKKALKVFTEKQLEEIEDICNVTFQKLNNLSMQSFNN